MAGEDKVRRHVGPATGSLATHRDVREAEGVEADAGGQVLALQSRGGVQEGHSLGLGGQGGLGRRARNEGCRSRSGRIWILGSICNSGPLGLLRALLLLRLSGCLRQVYYRECVWIPYRGGLGGRGHHEGRAEGGEGNEQGGLHCAECVLQSNIPARK